MPESAQLSKFFQTVSKVLLVCWLYGLVIGFAGYSAYMLAGDFIYRIHDRMFGLSKHELDLIFCCGMGFLKLLVIVFFLIPWLAIRFVLRMPSTEGN